MRTQLKNICNQYLAFILTALICLSCQQESFLTGYDTQTLFAQPVQSEIDAIKAEWTSRNLSVINYTEVQSQEILDSRATLKTISYSVGGYQEYAILIVPKSDTIMPVRMFLNGYSIATRVNSLSFGFNENAFEQPFILAIPALRGQSLNLTINGTTYITPQSGGPHCDAFDGATNGTIALLNVIEAHEPLADTGRVAAQGGSRGGTVAMLMGIRDGRVKRVVSVAGPANMLELTAFNENDPTYQCQFLSALVNQEVTLAEARKLIIASSPIFFAEDLPLTQAYFAADDRSVPAAQGEALQQRLIGQNLSNQLELFIYENRSHQTISVDNSELNERISTFLNQL